MTRQKKPESKKSIQKTGKSIKKTAKRSGSVRKKLTMLIDYKKIERLLRRIDRNKRSKEGCRHD
jgi:hypothetical protein